MPRFKIQELTVTQLEPTEKGPQFLATGTIRDLVSKTKTKPFVAKTIIWQGEPIFKVQEAGSLKDRKWKRGERISIARAVIGAVVAEFVAAEKGLGYFINFSTSMFQVPQAFAALMMLVVISLLLFHLIGLRQKICFPWSLPKAGH